MYLAVGELTGGTGPASDQPVAPGMEQPWLFWAPSISLAAITLLTRKKWMQRMSVGVAALGIAVCVAAFLGV